MDVIVEITQKRHSTVLLLDSGERFWLTWTQMQEHGAFAVGQEINSDELREWLLPRQYTMALHDAVSLLAQRNHASGEIRQKLKRKLFMNETIDMVLYKLEKEHLLDDAAFAHEWAVARTRSQIGRARILQELRMKGISAEIAQEALDEINADESDDAAIALAKKLLRRYCRENDNRKRMQKLLAAMARRGYNYTDSKRAVETALQEEAAF